MYRQHFYHEPKIKVMIQDFYRELMICDLGFKIKYLGFKIQILHRDPLMVQGFFLSQLFRLCCWVDFGTTPTYRINKSCFLRFVVGKWFRFSTTTATSCNAPSSSKLFYLVADFFVLKLFLSTPSKMDPHPSCTLQVRPGAVRNMAYKYKFRKKTAAAKLRHFLSCLSLNF